MQGGEICGPLHFKSILAQIKSNIHHPPCNPFHLASEMKGDTGLSDFEATVQPLWARAQEGDEKAYRQALDLMARRLRAYFRRRMPTLDADVEDLVQETLLAVHLQRGTYDPSFAVSAWFTAIARHKMVDLWRRRGRRDDLTDEYVDEDELEFATAPQETHALRDLAQLLKTLPELQRQAIELTKLEGLSVAEASEKTGVSESAIKVQVHRGLKRLAALVKG
jgi:RNA polymerase sigma-70 factor, ECF subfamily